MSLGFEGTRAIVTGAGSGIGRSAALRLAAEGASVLAVSTSDSAEVVADEIGAAGGSSAAAQCDVGDEDGVRELFRRFDDLEGGEPLDVLINAAGVGAFTATPETTLETWERVFQVNATGVFLCCREALGRLRRPGGSIVNVASVAASIGVPDRAAYCASKGAVVAYTRALAIDHVREGIRANTVSPGTTATPWIERVVADQGERMADLEARQPVGRLGTPEEIAEAIVMLASTRSGFTTGADWIVDGGQSAR